MKQYKGYEPQVTYDGDAQIFHGTVANIRGVITFEGYSVDELEAAFHESVDYYLDFCERSGIEPAKPYSGNFVLRITPDLHSRVAGAARKAGLSLNAWVATQLERSLLLGDVEDEVPAPAEARNPPTGKAGKRRSASVGKSSATRTKAAT